jgi:NAD-dependent histone deacetylase SIR2
VSTVDVLSEAFANMKLTGFIEGEEDGLDPQTASRLRSRLLHIGPEKFIHETLEVAKMRPPLLGTAFGINPIFAQQLGEDIFVRVLGAAILRTYYKRRKLAEYNTIDDAAKLLNESKNIMVITGAGISTSLGIPDFRSKTTGFYSKLQDMGFSEPEEVFDIQAFDEDPSTFYELAADIIPDLKRYSPTHAFIRLLQDKNKLQTNYTQNIDNLEELAGIDKNRLIQCHGSFATATCRKCKYKVKGTDIFPAIRAKRIARCRRCINTIAAQEALGPKIKKRKPTPRRTTHSDSDDEDEDDDIPQPGVMKPDITFFGEALPDHFFTRFTEQDVNTVDLVLVIGTSLKVAPVSDMPNYLPHHVPHIYVSREPIQHVDFDVQLLGNCDDVVVELARRTGWELKHEMVDQRVKMSVEGVEEYEHRWMVRKQAMSDERCDNAVAAVAQNGVASGKGAPNGFAHLLKLAEGGR